MVLLKQLFLESAEQSFEIENKVFQIIYIYKDETSIILANSSV